MNTGHFKPGNQPTSGESPNLLPVESTKPLLARLMSYPTAHTLEHIEKHIEKQRSITPQPTVNQSQSTSIPSANRSKRRNKPTAQQESIISTSAPISQELPLPATQNVSDSNGTTGFLRIQSPTNTSTATLRNQGSNITNTSSNTLASLFAHASGSTVRKLQLFVICLELIKYMHVLILSYLI